MSRSQDRTRFAKKSLGQNFLSDPNCIRKIVGALGPIEGVRVLEIGPGRGALTGALLEAGAVVTALELDRELIALLHSRYDKTGRFTLVEGDALEVDFEDLCALPPVRLVANLPYYISTAILQRLTLCRGNFTSLVLMLQKEVVERMTARAGGSDRGFLSVLVEANFEAEVLFDVSPNAFRPVPKVWSSVVRLVPKPGNSDGVSDETFLRAVSLGFSQKRKTILNNLRSSSLLPETGAAERILLTAGIDPRRRAETLNLSEWRRLAFHIGEALG